MTRPSGLQVHPHAPAGPSPIAGPTRPKRCTCGRPVGDSGECASCREKRRRASLHRAARLAAVTVVPPLVHDVLRGPGRPLDPAPRRFMESRFGHDFSRVRVHTDARAAGSAQAVHALAYVVGDHIVFGAGQYAPESCAGRRLLAHELTHVVQQRRQGQDPSQGDLVLSPPGGAGEREADDVAGRIARGGHAPEISAAGPGPLVQMQNGGRTPSGAPSDAGLPGGVPGPTPAPTSTPAPVRVCGPDVKAQVADAVTLTKTTFLGWSKADKTRSCKALISWRTGDMAWDIVELRTKDWIIPYRPACAFNRDDCGSSVKVDSDCHYMGSVNYVLFGVQFKLCQDFFSSTGARGDAADFTESEMIDWVNFYKGSSIYTGWSASSNFVGSKDWAKAGNRGWPTVATPTGDRPNCSPSCPTAYSGGRFHVRWYPMDPPF